MKSISPLSGSVALSLFLAASSATADSLRISGTITKVDDASLLASFSLGETYQMQYDWIGPAPEVSPGNFLRSGASLAFGVAKYDISATFVDYFLRLDNNVPFARVNISSRWFPGSPNFPIPLSYPSLIDGRFPYYIGLEMTDPTGTAFSTLELKSPYFPVHQFSQREFEIAFASQIGSGSADNVKRVFGTVDDISLITSPVPEDSSQTLLLAGLLTVYVLYRLQNGRRQPRNDA